MDRRDEDYAADKLLGRMVLKKDALYNFRFTKQTKEGKFSLYVPQKLIKGVGIKAVEINIISYEVY